MTDGELPAIAIVVELGRALDAIVSPRLDEVARGVAREVDAVLVDLGIPGRADVAVVGRLEDSDASGHALGVMVDGRRCRYPDQLIRQVGEVVLEAHLPRDLDSAAVVQRVRESGDVAMAARLVATSCGEIVKLRPSWLLGDAQAAAYAERLWATTSMSEQDWLADRLAAVLRAVLDLWIPIADEGRVGSALADAGDEPTEGLIAALRPDHLDIEVAPAFLHAIAESADEEQLGSVPYLREQLHGELGLRLPAFRFVPDRNLAAHEIRFRINALRTAPVLGVSPGMIFVNDGPGALAPFGIEATEATNVATQQPGSIADASSAELLTASAYTIWDSWQHLILTLAVALRTHGHRLIDASVVEEELSVLETVFPALAGAARQAVSVAELTRVMRALLRETVSVRDLQRILRTAIDRQDPAFEVEPGLQAGGDEPANGDLATAVRSALARQLLQQHASPGTDTIVAYLLDPEIERLLLADERLSDEDRDSVVRAVRAEAATLPVGVRLPVMVTTWRARRRVVEAVCDEVPALRVLAFEELVPDATVQPIARVSLTA